MSGCVAGVVIAAGVGEDAIWMELLVIVIVAAGAGVYGIIRKKGVRAGARQGYGMQRAKYGGFERLKDAAKTAAQKWTGAFAGADKNTPVAAGAAAADVMTPAEVTGKRFGEGRKRDTGSGMEILAGDFLVGVVEGLEGDDGRSVDMRAFSFNELVRRGELRAVESSALAVYAKDEHHLYGKRIQCEALKELAKRTGTQAEEQPSQYTGRGHAGQFSEHSGTVAHRAPQQ